MIKNDKDLQKAKQCVSRLEAVLEEARKAHGTAEYRSMSEPLLLELQQRESEILQYLSLSKEQVMAVT